MTTRDRGQDGHLAAAPADPVEARIVADLVRYHTAPEPPEYLHAALRRQLQEQPAAAAQPDAARRSPMRGGWAGAIRRSAPPRRSPWLAWMDRAVPVLLTVLAVVGFLSLRGSLPQARPGVAIGPVVRTVAVGRQPSGALIVDAQSGRAFVANQSDFTVSMLDTTSGSVLRTFSGSGGYKWVAVENDGRRVLVNDANSGTISVLDGHTGAILRTFVFPSDSHGDASQGALVVDDRTGHVFMVHPAGRTITMLDARSGAVLRSIDVCRGPQEVSVSARTGHVFVKCNDGTTAMLDAGSGRVLARVSTGSTYGCVLVNERTNRVFELGDSMVGSPHLAMLDAQTGRLLRMITTLRLDTYDTGSMSSQRGCPNVAIDPRSGRVYVAHLGPGRSGSTATGGEVAVVDGQTGAILRWFPVLANPACVAVDSQTGHLLVGSVGPVDSSGLPLGHGTLSVLDGVSGRVLRSVVVGRSPSAVVVDERTRRALVVNSNSDIYGMGLTANPVMEGTVTTVDLSHL
jgi:DNA-binding beta-propeller fold protein YncE